MNDDLISREAVGYYIQSYIHEIITESGIDKNEHTNSILRAILNGIKTMPSVTPTRPTGKWIEKEDYNLDTYYECSECGADYCIEGDILIHKYCPNCGARMEGE